MQGRLEVSADDIPLTLTVDVPSDELTKYVSNIYTPQKDELVSIMVFPWLYDRNGYLWDFAYPEI